MILEQLDNLLIEEEFNKVSSNLPEFSFFFRKENAYVNVIQVIDYRQGLYISEDQYTHIKGTIQEFFRQKGINDVHVLSLLVSADIMKAKQLCGQDAFCWLINPVENRLIVYENQVLDFYGMRNILETFLGEAEKRSCQESDYPQEELRPAIYKALRKLKGLICSGNSLIVAINVVLFVICMFTGDRLYNIGAFGIRDIIERREWYRIITCMFLHADISHLFSNMLVLYYIGNVVEKYIGAARYVIIYFLSGIIGNVFSAGFELMTGNFVSSVGASGAVFGIEGALLMLVIIYKGKCAGVTMGRLAFSIAFSLYCGFSSSYVNNAAHIGGVVTGFAAMGICRLFFLKPKKGG